MQNVMQIATNAGHTAQNGGRTKQNDGRTKPQGTPLTPKLEKTLVSRNDL